MPDTRSPISRLADAGIGFDGYPLPGSNKAGRIDCSRISNKGDLVAIVGVLALTAILVLTLALAVYVDKFAAGFFSATVIWKWHSWIYKPLDAWLDRLWAPDANGEANDG